MVSGEEMRLFQEDLARQKRRGYETLSHNEIMANIDIATAEALANATLQHEITTAAGEGWMQAGKALSSAIGSYEKRVSDPNPNPSPKPSYTASEGEDLSAFLSRNQSTEKGIK